MREISLNILDIAENSTNANAKNVVIELEEEDNLDLFKVTISDDGKGMSEDFLKNVVDPFTTTRTTRKVGMGIPLFKDAAIQTGGSFEIKSKVNVGTKVFATFVISSIDRMPLGDIASTMALLIMGHKEVDFILKVKRDEESFTFDTKEVKEILQTDDLNNIEVISFIKGFINENIENILGGEI